MHKKAALLPFIFFLAAAIIYISPLFKSITNWGQMDWDQFTFWNAVPRKTILTYHQFPLWNPYANGGNVLLAHPHSSFLSPFYLLVLFFGPIIGIKLQILLFVIIGLSGMFSLLKHLSIKEIPAYIASSVFMLSSIYSLHLTEGHVEWLGMALVPWLFLNYLKGTEKRKYLYIGILLLALMMLGGSVDVTAIAVLFLTIYALIRFLIERRISWVKNINVIFLGAFLVSSIKLIPMIDFLSDYPRKIDSSENISPLLLPSVLLDRNQGYLYSLTKWNYPDKGTRIKNDLAIDYGWHEYGAYVGIVPLLLFGAGIFLNLKRQLPLFLTGAIFLMLSLGRGSPIDLWKIFHTFPIYNSLHVPSRFIVIFIFAFSVFVGLGLSRIQEMLCRQQKRWSVLILALGLFILYDLCSVSGHILKQAFTVKPANIEENVEFKQRYTTVNFYPEISRSSLYPAFLSNSGIIDAYEVINVAKGNVLAADNQEYRGEAYLVNQRGSCKITSFSPNKISVSVNVNAPDILAINQNYYKGWRVKGAKDNNLKSFIGLISTQVDSSVREVVFYYLPSSFIIGSIISGVSLLFTAIFLVRR